MRAFPSVYFVFVLLFLGHLQGAEQLPAMRPALLGSGPRSLVNLIDTQKLAKGDVSAEVGMTVTIDANGNLKNTKLTSEKPAGLRFGAVVQEKLDRVTFLPAYFHGKPVASTTTIYFLFRGWGHGPRWRTDS